MRTIVITPPAPLLTAIQARAHMREASDFEDSLLEAYIAAATANLDGPNGILGIAIGPQTLELRRDDFCGDIDLECPPLTSITSVKYLDGDNVEQTLSTDVYTTINNTLVLKPSQSWPSTYDVAEAVRIRYAAGYETVPAPLLVAVRMMVADLARNRESTAYGAPVRIDMPLTVERLIAPYRRPNL